ncbi:MAG: hypothetical protein U0625_10540 [Phycisphaerales bacterium]
MAVPVWTLPLLAEADLGTPARAALVAAMVAGVVLLCFGARMLRPAVVLAMIVAGFVLAIGLSRAFVPDLPLWIAAIVGAILGLLAGALLYRPAVATISAFTGAAIGALVAWSIIAAGSLEAAPRELGHALVSTQREIAPPGEGERAGMAILSVLSGPGDAAPAPAANSEPQQLRHAADEAAARTADAARPVGERLLRDASATVVRATTRLRSAIDGTAPAYRTLMLASVAAGALVGFLAGLLATTTVARVLTSFAGAWLLLVSALPLLALQGYEPMPADARIWLVTLACIAILGYAAQARIFAAGARGGSRTGAKPAKAAEPAPTPAPAPDAAAAR